MTDDMFLLKILHRFQMYVNINDIIYPRHWTINAVSLI